MKSPLLYCLGIILLVSTVANAYATGDKLIIAHRGASGYLPEHTLEAKAMAHAMGAHYLEQDVVLSRDGEAVVLHDVYLDAVTNVKQRFPTRAREDGKFYVIDFDLSELRTLSVNERIDPQTNQPRFPKRFPVTDGPFRIHTLEDEIKFVQGLNGSTAREVGLYVELKSPAWHRQHHMDLGTIVLEILNRFGYTSDKDRVFIQSFDPSALRQIRTVHNSTIRLIQLIGENDWWPEDTVDYDFLKTPGGLAEVATYASGIGPWHGQIYLGENADNSAKFTALVADAHRAGLKVHPYTLRADHLPEDIEDFDVLLEYLMVDQNVDGVITDFPDRVRNYLSGARKH